MRGPLNVCHEMPMRSKLPVVVLLALGLAREATAQRVPPGTRVRLTTPSSFGGWHVGRVSAMTRDSVRIIYATGDSATIALANVGLMDYSSGTHTPPWAALSGVVTVPTGGVLGILGAMFTSLTRERPIDTYMEQGFWIGAGSGLVAGIVIATTNKREDWSPVMLPARTDRVVADSRVTAIEAPAYRPRMRLRMRVEGHKVEGTLVEQHDDSIVVAWNSVQTSYARASVSDVRVSRGKSAWTGAKFGALVGAGIGLVTGAREATRPNDANDLRDPSCDGVTTPCRYESDVVTTTKAVTGAALLGAIAGAVIRREQWVKSELPAPSRDGEPARLLLTPTRDGVRIGVRATF